MKISKMQNQSEINFLDKLAEDLSEKSFNNKQETIDNSSTEGLKGTVKSDNENAINSRFSNTILSAGRSIDGGVSDFGGPSKQIKTLTNNSIWDSDIVKKQSEFKSSKERTEEEKSNINKYRNSIKQESLDRYADQLSLTETSKESSIKNDSTNEGGTFGVSKNNMSIFDDAYDFSKLPEKTEGEKVSEEARKAKEKDDSWKINNGTKKMSSLIDSLFE